MCTWRLRGKCPWQSTSSLSSFVSVNRAFLLFSASAHTNYSILLPTGTAPRCRGHLKSSIFQLAIKCLINLQRCLLFLFPHTIICAVSLTLCSRSSQSCAPGPCLSCPINLAWIDTRCCHWLSPHDPKPNKLGTNDSLEPTDKEAGLVGTEKEGAGSKTCGQAKQTTKLAEHEVVLAPLWSPNRARTGSWKHLPWGADSHFGLKHRRQKTEWSTHSPDRDGFMSGNSPAMTYLQGWGAEAKTIALLSLCLQGQGDLSSAPRITAGLLTKHNVL